MKEYDIVIYGDETSLPLYNHVIAVTENLPVLGNPLSAEIRYLFHFSQIDDIETFTCRPMSYCWTDGFSAETKIVQTITSAADAKKYTSLYIIRIGLDEGVQLVDSPLISFHTQGKPGTCLEYALAEPVKSGDFCRVAITLTPSGEFFLP